MRRRKRRKRHSSPKLKPRRSKEKLKSKLSAKPRKLLKRRPGRKEQQNGPKKRQGSVPRQQGRLLNRQRLSPRRRLWRKLASKNWLPKMPRDRHRKQPRPKLQLPKPCKTPRTELDRRKKLPLRPKPNQLKGQERLLKPLLRLRRKPKELNRLLKRELEKHSSRRNWLRKRPRGQNRRLLSEPNQHRMPTLDWSKNRVLDPRAKS